MRKSKDEGFVNLVQGRMSVKEYALNFHQLSHNALELASRIRAIMRNFTSGLSHYFVLEYKAAMLNSDRAISKLMVYIQ